MVKTKRKIVASASDTRNAVAELYGNNVLGTVALQHGESKKKYDTIELALKSKLGQLVQEEQELNHTHSDLWFLKFVGYVHNRYPGSIDKASRILRHHLTYAQNSSFVFDSLFNILKCFSKNGDSQQKQLLSAIQKLVGFPNKGSAHLTNENKAFFIGLRETLLKTVYTMLAQDRLNALEKWLIRTDSNQRAKLISFLFNPQINASSSIYQIEPVVRKALGSIIMATDESGREETRQSVYNFFNSFELSSYTEKKMRDWKPRTNYEQQVKREKMFQFEALKRYCEENPYTRPMLVQDIPSIKKEREPNSPVKSVTFSPLPEDSPKYLPYRDRARSQSIFRNLESAPQGGTDSNGYKEASSNAGVVTTQGRSNSSIKTLRSPFPSAGKKAIKRVMSPIRFPMTSESQAPYYSPQHQQDMFQITATKEPHMMTPSNAKKPLRATVFDVSLAKDDASQPLESEFGTQESAYTALGIGSFKDRLYDNGTLKTPLSTGGASRVFKEFTELQYTGATTDSDVLLETGFFAHNARTSPIQIRNMGNDFKGEAEHASHDTQESIPAPDSLQALSPNISPAKSPTSFDSEEDALNSSPHVSTDPVLSPGVAFIQKATEWRKKARSSSGSGAESGQDVASTETVRLKESPSSAKKHSQEERAAKELKAIRELEALRATVEKLRLDNKRAQAAVKLAEEEKERAKEAELKELQLKLDALAAAKEALREESERNAETLKKELEEKVRELTAAQVLIEKQKIAQEEAIKAREANEVLQREIGAKQQELVEELNRALRDKEKNAVLINQMRQEAEALASEAKKLEREKQALENQVKVTGDSLEETTNNLEKLVTLMELQSNQEIDVKKYAEHGTNRAAQDFIGMELELRRTIYKTGFK